MTKQETINKEIEKANRRLDRLNDKLKALRDKHSENESNLTYWAGWDMGYLISAVSALEDKIDFLIDLNNI